jgi:hypothetical protein
MKITMECRRFIFFCVSWEGATTIRYHNDAMSAIL